MVKAIIVLISLGFLSFAHADSFKLTSDSFKGGKIDMDQVFNSFGCSGKNISPHLKWSGAPKDTKAFALTMFDPDAPTGSGFWHWVVFNMPADTKELTAGGEVPKGTIQSRTDFGKPGYGGPCPPPGKPHHYVFTIYALKDQIQADADASGALVGFEYHPK